jgi:hypothetical protein
MIRSCSPFSINFTQASSQDPVQNDRFHELLTRRFEKTRLRLDLIFGSFREYRNSLKPRSIRDTRQIPALNWRIRRLRRLIDSRPS